jgi:capsid protein
MRQYHLNVELFAAPAFRRLIPTAILTGKWTPKDDMRPRDYLYPEWMPPARWYIHPVQDVAAWSEAMKNGLMSRKRAAVAAGENVETIDIENARDKARAEELVLRYAGYLGDETAPLPASKTADKVAAITEAVLTEQVDRLETAEAD